jgi:hypothetical protein
MFPTPFNRIGTLDRISNSMRQGSFGNFTRWRGNFRRPITERRAETVGRECAATAESGAFPGVASDKDFFFLIPGVWING